MKESCNRNEQKTTGNTQAKETVPDATSMQKFMKLLNFFHMIKES